MQKYFKREKSRILLLTHKAVRKYKSPEIDTFMRGRNKVALLCIDILIRFICQHCMIYGIMLYFITISSTLVIFSSEPFQEKATVI